MAAEGLACPGLPPDEAPGAELTPCRPSSDHDSDMDGRPQLRRVHKQLLVFDIDGATAPKTPSLQDAFKKFRKKKQVRPSVAIATSCLLSFNCKLFIHCHRPE
jgi:hypothetical protein